MKKLMVTMMLMPMMALAYYHWREPGTYRIWNYTVQNDGSVLVCGIYGDPVGSLVIPSSIVDCSGLTCIGGTVTGIGDYAFSGCNLLTSVMIPQRVVRIGEGSFADCDGLELVELSENVSSIGRKAFAGCCGLTLVTIPESVTNIGVCAFQNCSGLKSVTIPSNVTSIEFGAFDGCSGLTSVTIPESVTNIGVCAFQNCSSLKSVTIPSSVTSIGASAFSGCSGLLSVMIPQSVTNIGDNAFHGCSGLTSVTIPAGVMSIGSSAFSGCSGLSNITLPFVGSQRGNSGSETALFGYIFGSEPYPGSIATKQYHAAYSYYSEYYIPSSLKSVVITDESKIGYGAFYGCSGLASVMISSSVTSIEENAFCNCSGLTSITIPESVTSIGRNAFSGCSGFGDGVFATDGWALCVNGNHSSVEIPMGVKRVIPGAFAGHAELMSVTVPTSVVQIGPGCFAGCSGLNGVRITDVAAWCGIDFESTDANPLYYAKKLYLNGKEVIYLDVPRGIEKIGRYAFCNANRFLSVTIPPSVKSVGAGAFAGCGGLSAVNVGDLSAWCGIDFATAEANPLYWAKKLYLNGTEIVDLAVPSGTESIERYAFYNGVDVASVMIPDTVKSIGTDAFKGCTGIKSATVPEKFSISDVFPDSRASMTTVMIPADATSIADGAFSGCGKIASIVIPPAVTCIGARAFDGCGGLTVMTIPASVIVLGASAFRGCTQITEIEIPEGVGELPDSLCEGCGGLTTVVIPNSVSNISSTAFKDCGNIVSVTMPGRFVMKDVFPSSYSKIHDVTILNGEEVLQKEVFSGCSALATVVISEGVTTLGEDLFYNFTNLRELTIPSTVTSIGGYALYGCSSLETIHVSNDGDIDALKQMLYESGFDVNSVTFDYVEEPVVVSCKVRFDVCGGVAEWSEVEVREGDQIGELPMAERDGYECLGWFTSASGGRQVSAATVVTADVTYYAQWRKIGGVPTVADAMEAHVDVAEGETAPYAAAAAVYDGYLYDANGVIAGSVQVKVAKMKNGEAKVTATVQLADGSKKLSFKNGVADAAGNVTGMFVGGHALNISLGVNGMGGSMDGNSVDGARNLFGSKSKEEKAAADAIANTCIGTYNIVGEDGVLTVSVAKKGKAKVSGTWKGAKVSVSSQLLIGESVCVVPVVFAKKGVSLAFNLNIFGANDVTVTGLSVNAVGKPGTLAGGAAFRMNGAALAQALPGLLAAYLPDCQVAQSGAKWVVAGGAKAGKLALVKGTSDIDPAKSKFTDNMSGLKLTYKVKDGSFKGSFKAYSLENGKLKSYTVNVTGVMVGDTGYGTATLKKPAVSFPISVE